MAFYQHIYKQILPTDSQTLWDFISSPANLKVITPPHMGFDITSRYLPEKMHPGMIISYRVSPFPGYNTDWVTEITHVEEGRYFVDEQRLGPYALWHHQHHIEPTDDGMLMTDIVTYAPPLGFIGTIANTLLIKRKLNQIFSYRKSALQRTFPSRLVVDHA